MDFNEEIAKRAAMTGPEIFRAVEELIEKEKIALPTTEDEASELYQTLVLRVLGARYKEEERKLLEEQS